MYSDFFFRKKNSECLFFNNVLKYINFQKYHKHWEMYGYPLKNVIVPDDSMLFPTQIHCHFKSIINTSALNSA